jgi:hypothetical protein
MLKLVHADLARAPKYPSIFSRRRLNFGFGSPSRSATTPCRICGHLESSFGSGERRPVLSHRSVHASPTSSPYAHYRVGELIASAGDGDYIYVR